MKHLKVSLAFLALVVSVSPVKAKVVPGAKEQRAYEVQDIKDLVALLKGKKKWKSWKVQGAIAELAVGLKSKEAKPLLLEALTYEHVPARIKAMRALAWIGSADCVDAIAGMLKDKQKNVRLAAVYALRTIRNEAAGKAILKALNDPEPRVRGAAILGVGEMKSVVPPEVFAKMLKEGGEDQRAAVIRAAVRVRAKNALELVKICLKDKSPKVRAVVLGAIVLHRPKGIALDDLVPALKDKDAQVRAKGVLAVSRYKDKEVTALIVAMVGDDDTVVRKYVATAAAMRPFPEVKELYEKLLSDESTEMRLAAVESLAVRQMDAKCAPLLVTATEDKSFEVALRAIYALEKHNKQAVSGALAKLYKRVDTRTRERLFPLLPRLPKDDYKKMLTEALKDRSDHFRASAVQALSMCSDDVLLELAATAAGDVSPMVRATLVSALRSKAGNPAAKKILQQLAKDPDKHVSRRARQAIGLEKNPATKPARR